MRSTHCTRRLGAGLGLTLGATVLLSACGGGAPSHLATKATSNKMATTTTTGPAGPPAPPTTTTTEVNIPLSAIADSGLPSKIGPGPLKAPVIKELMQYFENQVATAYGTGQANSLESYLAGPMLTGNRATIEVMNGQDRRNVFKIDVGSISIDNNETDRVVFDMKGEMTTDYFENTQSNQLVADGLPGPSSVDFMVFLDFNPHNRTWYWTGEQNEDTSSSSGSTGSAG
jgi:hypothetical protein